MARNTEQQGSACLRTIAHWDVGESLDSKRWGGLLRDFTLSCQGGDFISFEGKKKNRKKEKARSYIPQPSVCKSRYHNASECSVVLVSLDHLNINLTVSLLISSQIVPINSL